MEINLPAVEYIRRQQFTRYYCTFDIYPHQRYALELISVTPKANANQLYTMRLQLKKEDKQGTRNNICRVSDKKMALLAIPIHWKKLEASI